MFQHHDSTARWVRRPIRLVALFVGMALACGIFLPVSGQESADDDKDKTEKKDKNGVPELRKFSEDEAKEFLTARSMMVAYITKSGTERKQLVALLKKEGLTIVVHLDLVSAFKVKVPDIAPDKLAELLARLANDPVVADVIPDSRRSVDCRNCDVPVVHSSAPTGCLPNDPRLYEQWGLQSIRAPQAWCGIRTTPIIVAVIDTGIDFNHPDLQANIWINPERKKDKRFGEGFYTKEDASGKTIFTSYTVDEKNGTYDSESDVDPGEDLEVDGVPIEGAGHGTHVAGIIGAVGNNRIGVSGVAWNVKILPIRAASVVRAKEKDNKTLKKDKSGKQVFVLKMTESDEILAIEHAIHHGAKIINLSFGHYGKEVGAIYHRLHHALEEKGVLFVTSAGNEDKDTDVDTHLPSSLPFFNVLSVTAIDQHENQKYNFGKSTVHIAAPGYEILSTVPGGGFGVKNGTSMATPFVSGAAALLWGHPKWNRMDAAGIKAQLMDNARPLNSLVDKCRSEATLDLSFICRDCAWPPPPTVFPPEVCGADCPPAKQRHGLFPLFHRR